MRRLVVLAAVVTTALAPLLVGAPARAAALPLPTADPFYTYTGKTPLAQVPPGSILLDAAGKPQERSVDLAADTNASPLPTGLQLPAGVTPLLTAEQVLYRTSDELGHPSATVTTILVPAAAAVSPKIVAYLSFYDSLSAKCDPSYTLRGGDPGSANTNLTDVEQALVQLYAVGDVVTVPDFEGEHLDWTAGHEAGYGTLDAVRATEQYLEAPATTPVGLTGYSGGSIAADWASELAPTYAPELDIAGVAEGGIPVDFAHNLDYIEGTSDWAPVIPATLATLSRSYGVDLTPYLSAEGIAAVAKTRDQCIGDFGTYPGLTIQSLLKPQYSDPYAIAPFRNIINTLIMGTEPGHPKGPLLMQVGNDPNRKQGQGDDIMVTADVQALAHEYCSQGVSVDYLESDGLAHTEAAIPFELAAMPFLQAALAGVTPPDNCSSVPVGNSLAPVQAPRAPAPPATGTTPGTSTSAAAASGAGSGAGDLAFTGADPLVAVAALVLCGAGVATAVARRR